MLEPLGSVEAQELRASLLQPHQSVARSGVAAFDLRHQALDRDVDALEHQLPVTVAVLVRLLSGPLEHRLDVAVALREPDPELLRDRSKRPALNPQPDGPLLPDLDLGPLGVAPGRPAAFRLYGVPFSGRRFSRY